MSEAASVQKLASEMESPQKTPVDQTKGVAAQPTVHQYEFRVFLLSTSFSLPIFWPLVQVYTASPVLTLTFPMSSTLLLPKQAAV